MKCFEHSVNFLFVLLTNFISYFTNEEREIFKKNVKNSNLTWQWCKKEKKRKERKTMIWEMSMRNRAIVVVAEVSSLFSLWHELRHCHINSLCVLCVLISAQFSMPFFCNWHSAMCVPCVNSGEAVQQAPPCTFIFGLKSRGDITAIPFVRILCHLFIKRKLFI